VDGYANLIVARLRRLAATTSTGALPFTGYGEGDIFFREGRIVYAQSSRTPARRAGGLMALGLAPSALNDEAASGALVNLAAVLSATEATVDAASELLASESRYAKFRPGEAPSAIEVCDLALDALLEEIDRRHRVLRQLFPGLTPDTIVARAPDMAESALQVSALQWALLLRVRGGATPRRLAMELRRSVFGTTLEVHRLVKLGLLRGPGGAQPLSFIRAVTDER
jgi:hypothetical protein